MAFVRSRPSRPAAAASGWLQQRATLEGLEVQDSSWDEWVAAEQAALERQQRRVEDSGTGPLRRLMKQAAA
jgi:hypothetical protein